MSYFRPLAGIMVLINLESCNDYDWDRQISVPLRGLWFLSMLEEVKDVILDIFPSPCGDYGSYRRKPDEL